MSGLLRSGLDAVVTAFDSKCSPHLLNCIDSAMVMTETILPAIKHTIGLQVVFQVSCVHFV